VRIVHAPTEIAGQMGILCHGLRKAGMEVNGYNWFHSYIGYKENIMNTDAYELAKIVDPIIQHCDVIHYHNGNTMVANHNDLPYAANTGKKLVMHHWGNDVRTSKWVKELNPYPLPSSYLSNESIHHQLVFFSRYIDTAIVQDYEVYPYVRDYYKNVCALPLACRTERFTPVFPSPDNLHPIIIHAPTNREFKGSAHVERAIEQVKKESQFTYIAIEKMSHQQALQAYSAADIIIDQILCGSYGLLSVEAMALGKPVIAFIRDDLVSGYEITPPICNANPDTLYTTLKALLSSGEVRRQKGMAGRKFVESYHDSRLVAKQLVTIYRNL
jgi:hypothetical protein